MESEELLKKLSILRAKDISFSALGASTHGYELNPPLSESDIAAFENNHGVHLPSDNREFLLRCGNGGAGPFYGLFPLGVFDGSGGPLEPWREGDGFAGILSKPSELTNGAFPICHQGCAYRNLLVVCGQEYGHIWLDARASDGGIMPVEDAAGRRMTFLSWYTAWLDVALEGRKTV